MSEHTKIPDYPERQMSWTTSEKRVLQGLIDEIIALKASNKELVELLTEARDDVAAQADEYQQLLPYKQHRYDAQKETLDGIDEALAKAKEQQ